MKILEDYLNLYKNNFGAEPTVAKDKTNYICLTVDVVGKEYTYVFIKDGNDDEVAKLEDSLYEEYEESDDEEFCIEYSDVKIFKNYIDPEMGEKIFTVLSEEYKNRKIKEENQKIFFDKYKKLEKIIKELQIPDFIPYEEDNPHCEEDFENLNKICSKVAEENNVTYENGCFYFENVKFARIDLCGFIPNAYAKLAWVYNPED